MKARKPTLTSPITLMTRATISCGRWRENTVTARVHTVSISAHSSSEPSWLPQVAATRYCSGSLELELVITLTTEKSLLMNEYIRQPKAIATNTNCP